MKTNWESLHPHTHYRSMMNIYKKLRPIYKKLQTIIKVFNKE